MMHKRRSRRSTKIQTEPDWAEWEKISHFNQLDLEYDKFVYICEECRTEHGLFDIKNLFGGTTTHYKCKGIMKYYALNGEFLVK